MTTLTFDGFKKIAKGLKAAYRAEDFMPDEYSLKIWYYALMDLSYEQVSAACHKYIATGTFPPSIAEIRSIAVQIAKPETEKSWADGWEQLMRAIGRFGYYRQSEALASMDDITKSVVRRLGWKDLCVSGNSTADRANFRMVYEQEQNRTREKAVLPTAIQEQIETIRAGVQALTEGDGNAAARIAKEEKCLK